MQQQHETIISLVSRFASLATMPALNVKFSPTNASTLHPQHPSIMIMISKCERKTDSILRTLRNWKFTYSVFVLREMDDCAFSVTDSERGMTTFERWKPEDQLKKLIIWYCHLVALWLPRLPRLVEDGLWARSRHVTFVEDFLLRSLEMRLEGMKLDYIYPCHVDLIV